MFTHVPEPEQGRAQPQAPIKLARCKEPIEGDAKVVDFSIALRKPVGPLLGAQFWISLFGEHQTVSRVRLACGSVLSAFSQPLESIFADRLEHCEARLRSISIHILEQILVDQGR